MAGIKPGAVGYTWNSSTLQQEDGKFEANPSNIARPCFKKRPMTSYRESTYPATGGGKENNRPSSPTCLLPC
jgi:hypothetical protein